MHFEFQRPSAQINCGLCANRDVPVENEIQRCMACPKEHNFRTCSQVNCNRDSVDEYSRTSDWGITRDRKGHGLGDDDTITAYYSLNQVEKNAARSQSTRSKSQSSATLPPFASREKCRQAEAVDWYSKYDQESSHHRRE